jgi:putative hydrolase of the HAD superfamily
MRPKGVLFDYGGTLVEEVHFDPQAGNQWLFSQASYRPPHVTFEDVIARANRVTAEVAGRRDYVHIETAWPTLTRLVHDFLGIRFDASMAELEMGFWRASVRTRPIAGVRDVLERLHGSNIPIGVVSNTCFGAQALRFELAKHDLADYLSVIVVSADYSVRKPNVLLFDTAAARLGVHPRDTWFVGDRLDTDVIGAKAAGMTAVWFNPGGARDTSNNADLAVADWGDFLQHALSPAIN